jgi:hypothetical protein
MPEVHVNDKDIFHKVGSSPRRAPRAGRTACVRRKLAQIDRSTPAGLHWSDVKLAGQSVTLTFFCKGKAQSRCA